MISIISDMFHCVGTSHMSDNQHMSVAMLSHIDTSPHILGIATDCCVWTDQLKSPLVKRYTGLLSSNVLLDYHSNGHVLIVAHVGGTHTCILLRIICGLSILSCWLCVHYT
jgi:hypothetical protein